MGEQPVLIPARFEKYFWDCEFKTLKVEDHKKFIAERILMYGEKDTHVRRFIFTEMAE